MLDAAKPVFEFLYAFLRENFWRNDIRKEDLVFYMDNPTEEQEEKQKKYDVNPDGGDPPSNIGLRPFKKDRFFDRFERGVLLGEVGNFPAVGCLDFGQITDIVPDRSPDGYSYELHYSLLIQARTGVGKSVREVYRNDLDSPRGIGDIVTEVIQKAWDQLHVGMLTKGNYEFKMGSFEGADVSAGFGQFPLSQNNWWVKEWTCNVNGEVVDTTSEFRDVNNNAPDSAKRVIVFKFIVFEQVALV